MHIITLKYNPFYGVYASNPHTKLSSMQCKKRAIAENHLPLLFSLSYLLTLHDDTYTRVFHTNASYKMYQH